MNMDFIMAPAIVGIVFLSIYKIFELIVRRKERMTIIEKFSGIDCKDMKLPDLSSEKIFGRFVSLRFGCLFLGIGLGLLIGIAICTNLRPAGILLGDSVFEMRNVAAMVNGASVMLFGGLGMLISFIIESIMSRKEKK